MPAMVPSMLIAFAGLMGAAGVALAAASTHVASGVGLDTAAYFLLLHGTALVALAGAIERALIGRTLGMIAALALVAGTALFSGEVALRALKQVTLFRMAAPTGGFLMIGGWLVVTLAALGRLVRR